MVFYQALQFQYDIITENTLSKTVMFSVSKNSGHIGDAFLLVEGKALSTRATEEFMLLGVASIMLRQIMLISTNIFTLVAVYVFSIVKFNVSI